MTTNLSETDTSSQHIANSVMLPQLPEKFHPKATNKWTCSICNRTMHVSGRVPHQEGKTHKTQLANRTKLASSSTSGNTNHSTSENTYHPASIPATSNHGPLQPKEVAERWTCTICNRTMQMSSKAPHLAGIAHRKKLDGKSASGSTDHPSSSRIPMPITQPQGRLHPNGKRLIHISSVATVYQHMDSIPHWAYKGRGNGGRRRSNMVTPEDVEHASDYLDGVSIAYDIDTQWGLKPEGGAYKDSNHYCGPNYDIPF